MTFEEFYKEWTNDKSWIVAHTSGSTGDPKEIKLPKRLMLESALRTNSFFNIDTGSRLHSPLSADYIAGKMMLIRALAANAGFSYEEPSNDILHSASSDETIDLLAVVPSQLEGLCRNKNPLPMITHIIVGGSALDPRLAKETCARLAGTKIYETYGMTETASHIALRQLGKEWFHTLEGIEVKADDRECLVIHDGNREIITNDLCHINSASEFIITGRYDNVIITGGLKVNPEEVERLLRSRWKHDAFMLTSRPDPKWTSRLVLLYEQGKVNADAEDISTLLHDRLPAYKCPKEIIAVNNLPRTTTGKLKRTNFKLS